MIGDKFNTAGTNGRDCPRCFRVGTLSGLRQGDAPKLTCTGCAAHFILSWSAVPGMPDTLTQIAVADPPFRSHWQLTSPRPSR